MKCEENVTNDGVITTRLARCIFLPFPFSRSEHKYRIRHTQIEKSEEENKNLFVLSFVNKWSFFLLPRGKAKVDSLTSISWIKSLFQMIRNKCFSSSSTKTKRSLAEEAECGSMEGIRSWLHDGADINAFDAYGYTPLINATMLNRVDVVRALIDAGADVQRKGPFGYTPLHAAAQCGYLEVVQELVRRGADVNAKNNDEDIPLILAVRGSHAEIVDYLLKAGSDIHQNGWLGQSAVHTAIANGDQATAEALLRRQIMVRDSIESQENF